MNVRSFTDKNNARSDEKIIRIVESEMRKDGYDHFEIESITSLDKPNISFVIVHTGVMEISVEVNNITGKILNKEKIAR